MPTISFLTMLAAAQINPQEFVNEILKKHPVWAIIVALLTLLPGFIKGLQTVLDQIGRRTRYERAKVSLEILKTKYEIEAIRRREQLDLPPIPVAAEELEEVRVSAPHTREVRWFQSERLRKTFTFRNIVNHPKSGKVLANIGVAAAGFYGIGMVAETVVYLLPELRNQLGSWRAAGLSVASFLMGAALLLWAVRIYKTKQLATAELDERLSDKSPRPTLRQISGV